MAERLVKGLAVAFVLAGASAFLAHEIAKEAYPGCSTCGSRFTFALWLIGVGAHQPILWNRYESFLEGVAIWCLAVTTGVIVYFGARGIAANLAASGDIVGAAQLVGYASGISVLLPLLVSGLLVYISSKWLRTALRITGKVLSSGALLLAIGVLVTLLQEGTGLIGDGTATVSWITACLPAMYLMWAPPTWPRPTWNGTHAWFAREWRLVPFYVAAVLVSLAALRYIFSE